MLYTPRIRILQIFTWRNGRPLHAGIMPKRQLQEPSGEKRFKQLKNLTDLLETENFPVAHSRHNLSTSHSESSTMQRAARQQERDARNGSDVNTAQIPRSQLEYLDTPIKSESDKKEYRVIKLPNGLTALLISDPHSPHASADGDDDDDKKSTTDAVGSAHEEETEGESSESDGGSQEESSEGSDSDENERSSKKNTPKKEEKLAACGLCVGVGSFSDPPEIQGMAHFLEHMVFMGSEKYPRENEFDSFLTKAGGSDNAYTDLETTTFYFNVLEQHLLPALDRFAQFFISPLMKRDAISREREAVDSEFQMALPSDSSRKNQLIASFAKDNHPVKMFSWGNLVTLRDNVTEDKLYEELHKFRKRHYSAHRMKLAIQARLPLDTLEKFVIECFSDVPNNGLPPDDFSHFKGPVSFDTPDFRSIYKVKPVKDICEVTLTWVMSPLLTLYKSKPRNYLSAAIHNGGKGSLITYLRKKMWCLSMCSMSGESGCEYNSVYALFTFTLTLTDEGMKHLKDVLDAVFSYINMLRAAGPQEGFYNDLRRIEENDFRFESEEASIDIVQTLCDDMHIYHPLHYLSGGDLYFEYDPDAIQACMDVLTPDNVNIIVVDKKLSENELDKVEPWFKTKYNNVDIPKEWIEEWRTIQPFPEFGLPLPNMYIADNFSLIPVVADLPRHPVKVYHDSITELWYMPDFKYRLPECFTYMHFISPIKNFSPENAALMCVYLNVLTHQVAEELYPARKASINLGCSLSDMGFFLKVEGYNQKLPLMLTTFVKYMVKCADTVTEELFDVMRKDEIKVGYNHLIKPARTQEYVAQTIKTLTKWTPIDTYRPLFNITFEQFKHFIKCFLDRLYIQCLIQGNISKEEAINTVQNCMNILKCKPLYPNTMPGRRYLQVPLGVSSCKLRNLNKKDANSVVMNYYHTDLASMKTYVTNELMLSIMEEPVYNQLRTLEQLGYDVSCYVYDLYPNVGYSVEVRTQADKYTTEHVDARIEEFLKSFKKKLEDMSTDELNVFKETVIKQKQRALLQLKEQVEVNWAEVQTQHLIFDRPEREIEALKDVTLDDVRAFLNDHTLGGNKLRKLSIQVVGTTLESGANTDPDDNGELPEYPLEYITDSNWDGVDHVITDIATFKRKLYIYPDNLGLTEAYEKN